MDHVKFAYLCGTTYSVTDNRNGLLRMRSIKISNIFYSSLWKRVIAWERSCPSSAYGIVWGMQVKTNIAEFKAAKYEIQKPSTCRATLFRCKFLSMFPVFHLARST